ncbi:hypothetical protein D9611_008183 [Ephemerocybe angulata]|uniref:MYND-type domain-containing protein n=1 Tax=Ephemerocybe angulata TaxID=980116 RepID=A0A8H5BZG0_9AGAR|nr:hypothetical protein D9611_008183 [Tulosesus angulatus]
MVSIDFQTCRNVLALVRRPRLSIMGKRRESTIYMDLALQSYMSYGLGSGLGGKTVSELTCYNDRAPGAEGGNCPNSALLACAQCSLVKYCSGRCQRQHWQKHRIECESSLNKADWQPHWIKENRVPYFYATTSRAESKNTSSNGLWGRLPAYNILQLSYNEGLAQAVYKDIKLCFTAASDIRNLVETLNSLPKGYQGTCDVLLNEADTVSANRNLVILYILMTAGPSIDEAAELAMHLMYSSRLTANMAAYLSRCVHMIYGDSARCGDMTFQRTFPTRGRGKLYSAQPAMAIKRPVEMFLSRYELGRAMRRMKDTMFDGLKVDERHKLLSRLEPPHRLAHVYFWKTGVLAPFSLDLKPFTQPNRLAFTPQGSWLGKSEDLSPLHGWDIAKVQATGLRNGVDPTGDMFGCLFFHVKQELREFISRVKDFHINIHHTQYDPRLLSKGVSIGVLPSFSDASFDRIDLGDLGDRLGIKECLEDWGLLLNRENVHSCVVAHSKRWIDSQPALSRVPLSSPQSVLDFLRLRCRNIPSLEPRLKKMLEQGTYSPAILRLIESLDAFVDYGPSFQEYLASHNVLAACGGIGLQQRKRNDVHPKVRPTYLSYISELCA